MTDEGQGPWGRGWWGRGYGTYQGRVNDSTPNEPEVKVEPGQGAGAEGLLVTVVPAPANKSMWHLHMSANLCGITTGIFRSSNPLAAA